MQPYTTIILVCTVFASLGACASAPVRDVPDGATAAGDGAPPAITDAGGPIEQDRDDAAPHDSGSVPPSCVLSSALSPGDHIVTVVHGGRTREAVVHVPPGAGAIDPMALVLMFHGLSSSPEDEVGRTGWSDKADEEGFVVAYPRGVLSSWNAGECCGGAMFAGVDDVGFVRALIDAVAETVCIDRARVFATGFSNGAMMTHRLACEMSDVIAGFVAVSGVLMLPLERCTPARPVRLLHIHGTGDRFEPYDGNPLLRFRSVDETIAGWLDRQDCTADAEPSFPAPGVRCDAYRDCLPGAEITLCAIADGGHEWPLGEFSATNAAWELFARPR